MHSRTSSVGQVEVPNDYRLHEPLPAQPKPGLFGRYLVLSDMSVVELPPDEAMEVHTALESNPRAVYSHALYNYGDKGFPDPNPPGVGGLRGRLEGTR